MFEKQLNNLRSLQPLLQAVDKTEINALAKFLYDRISHPDSYLVFLGETSSGKSSIINGLLGDHILPVKASPTTAAITEVELCNDISENEYVAIYKDATFEDISLSQFKQLCLKPTYTLARLKVRQKISNKEKQLNHLRIFDTPGYGSIIKEHEEVLKDFLPNSDIIVYTVNYRSGIKENDYAFLRFLKELVRDDVQILLLINMCPQGIGINDSRVQEILEYVNSLLHIDTDIILQSYLKSEDGINRPLVNCSILWEQVNQIINNPKRIDYMEEIFDDYVMELYDECDKIIQNRYYQARLSKEEHQAYVHSQLETSANIRSAINQFICPTFKRIRERLPEKLNVAESRIVSTLHTEIDNSDSMKREDTQNYFNAFLIPHTIDCFAKDEVVFYIETELTNLNNLVDDYINQEIVKLNTKIKKIEASHLEKQAQNLVGGLIQREGAKGLGRYFAKFGGAGGSNAGIANAASHYLKEVGDLFNKRFSRETHNALKHYMAKFGATSMKAVAAALAVLIEVVSAAYEVARFKSKFKKEIDKAVSKWNTETLPLYLSDLEKLEEENINTIREIASEFESNIAAEPQSLDIEICYQHVLLSQQIRKNLVK